ncbi:MAG TPA: trigger factor [Candidatus Latescibacteria bacterium]|nr:trigger factor [Candidatus Latescibacterota bacterium]
MKLEVTETAPCSRRINIEVEPDAIEERITSTVKEYRRTRTIPGFRPGKATDSVIRRWFGKDIRAQVIRDLMEESWQKALEENKLQPVDQAQIDSVNAEPGEPLRFSGTVEVKPQFDVQDYKGLPAIRPVHTVTEEDVTRQVNFLRERRATETPVERPAQNGDVVVIDLQKLDETGVPLIGQKQDNLRWVLGGTGSVSKDLDEQIVGMAQGDTRNVTFHYREDFYDPNRAGKEEKASITLKEVRERIVPEITEDFLKELGEYATENDLRKDLEADIKRRLDALAKQQVHVGLKSALVERNQIEVPETLVQRLLTRMFQQHKQQGHEHDENEFRAEHREDALREVRASLLLERIAAQESIVVPDEDVDARIARMAASMGTSVRNLRDYMINNGQYEQIRYELQEEAVLNFLEEQAAIEESPLPKK